MSCNNIHSSLCQDLAAITGACKSPHTPVTESPTPCSLSSSMTSSSGSTKTPVSSPCTTTTTNTNAPHTPVTALESQVIQAGNILKSIELIEGQIYEIANAIVNMNTDVSDIEQKLVRRILDSLVESK